MSQTLLFGGSSILGWNLFQRYRSEMVAFCPPYTAHENAEPMRSLRLESAIEIGEVLRSFQPNLLIHCGGICDVEKCEENPDFAKKVNVESIRLLTEALGESTRLVYVSSDHVFGEDGTYNERSEPDPISFYGECRVKAEKWVQSHANHLIIRHGLPLGSSLSGKNGHRDWLRYRLEKGLPVTIVKDEARSVVSAEALAGRVWALAHSEVMGIRHIESQHFLDRPRLARKLVEKLNLPGEIAMESRNQRQVPHLGRIELKTIYQDAYSEPLSAW